MTTPDGFSDAVADALPRCPRCLVLLVDREEGGVVYLHCPSCDDVFM